MWKDSNCEEPQDSQQSNLVLLIKVRHSDDELNLLITPFVVMFMYSEKNVAT